MEKLQKPNQTNAILTRLSSWADNLERARSKTWNPIQKWRLSIQEETLRDAKSTLSELYR